MDDFTINPKPVLKGLFRKARGPRSEWTRNPDQKRFMDEGHEIFNFGNYFLVQCPRCGKMAKVRPTDPSKEKKLASTAAAFNEKWFYCPWCRLSRVAAACGFSVDNCLDWAFQLPLWLQTNCRGNRFFAYNLEHLDFLESYVGAKLRERRPIQRVFEDGDGIPMQINKTMASRLPRWMKLAKNRKAVLKAILQLRKKTEEGQKGKASKFKW